MKWNTAGLLTNPAVNTILTESDVFVGDGPRPCLVMVASTVACVVVYEWRNAANDANKQFQAFPVAANGFMRIDIPYVDALEGERFRLRLNAAITGVCQASLFM